MQAFKIENSNGRIGIFAEKVSGKTLRDWINADFFKDKNKIINSKRILNVLLQVAVGMHYLHRKGFVHQSITPDNIYV
jgi:serine/threonine protein kinase